MDHRQLKSVVEALVFVAEEPMTVGSLALVLGEAGVEKAAITQALESLHEEYRERGSGIELRQVAGGYQFRTRQSAATWIQRLNVPKPTRLSQAAMETLAIVAYRQPIVRAEVEEIRGVDCGGVLKTLLERDVIRIIGKRDEPGSPLLYGTTQEFLSLFNLESLKDLPSLREYHELEMQTATTVDDAVAAAAEAEAAAEAKDAPIEPIAPEEQIALDNQDQHAIDELEDQIRSLRHLEQNIFPKPETTITAVLKDEVAGVPVEDVDSIAQEENLPQQ